MKTFTKIIALLAIIAAFCVGLMISASHGIIAGAAAFVVTLHMQSVCFTFGTPLLGSRLSSLSSNPTLRNFAKDASQKALKRVALFLAPLVRVPDVTGFYKTYSAKNRYKRPKTILEPGGSATRIGFTASDTAFNLQPHGLDFPIPSIDGMSDESLLHHAQYGTQLLADAAALDHEAETISAALTAAGAGTDSNFTSAGVDPIAVLDAAIIAVMKAAKNGAPVKVLFGATALLRTKNNANVKARFVAGTKNGLVTPGLLDISAMLFGNPKCEVSLYVSDSAAEGVAESIDFMLDTQILVFASNDEPNTMDPSFLKTLVPMAGFMKPGSYNTADDRGQVLKMDWSMQLVTANSSAVVRINATAA